MIDIKSATKQDMVEHYEDALGRLSDVVAERDRLIEAEQRAIDAHNETRAELVAERGAHTDTLAAMEKLYEFAFDRHAYKRNDFLEWNDALNAAQIAITRVKG